MRGGGGLMVKKGKYFKLLKQGGGKYSDIHHSHTKGGEDANYYSVLKEKNLVNARMGDQEEFSGLRGSIWEGGNASVRKETPRSIIEGSILSTGGITYAKSDKGKLSVGGRGGTRYY